MIMRISKTSKENARICDFARIHIDGPDWVVAIYKNGAVAYLHTSDGPARFPSIKAASDAIKKINKNVYISLYN